MTPKEKAFELITKFQHPMSEMSDTDCLHIAVAKEFSLIAVDEILELKETQEEYQIQYDNGEWSRELGYRYSKYWQEVKKEIDAL